MTLLSVVQQHCRLHGLNIPTSVIGNADFTVAQLYGIVMQVVDEMVNESKFNVTTYETTFTTTATEDQGALATLAPYGYQFAYRGTFFNRSTMEPLYGPLEESEWQAVKALPTAGPKYKFRIRQNHLLLNPTPTAGQTIAFEYASSWATTTSTGTPQAALTADTDLFVFPERIIQRGLAFRWKQIKGLPYQADETQFYNLLNNYIARDKIKRAITLGDSCPDLRPGIFIAPGSTVS